MTFGAFQSCRVSDTGIMKIDGNSGTSIESSDEKGIVKDFNLMSCYIRPFLIVSEYHPVNYLLADSYRSVFAVYILCRGLY